MRYLAALGAALLLNATANLLMKLGAGSVAESGGVLKNGLIAGIRTVLSTPSLVIGLSCFALNAAFYVYALQSTALKISIAYPIMVGGGFAAIAVAARVHPDLQERLTVFQWLGVCLILIGVVVIALDSKAPVAHG